MKNKFFNIATKKAPWGDYGDILLTGMPYVSNGSEIMLERSGPFIPDIYEYPGMVIINNLMKNNLEKAFPDIEFLPVHKTKIVDIDWLNWDFMNDEPLIYPESGEPEDYINERKHNKRVSEQMGNVWAIKIPVWYGEAFTLRYYLPSHASNIPYNIFRSEKTLNIIVSQNLKEWIENNGGEWLVFNELEIITVNDP